MSINITITLNGKKKTLAVAPTQSLLSALRNNAKAKEVKDGCSDGDCGACTVLMDGKAVNSCLVLAPAADGSEIVTVKGLGTAEAPSAVQESFVNSGAIQCGYCTAGMVISATAFLNENPDPTRTEIREGLSGNLCRCTGYQKIIDAVANAAKKNHSQGE
ncbi:(2Fe-2S)-binding protein [Desulforhopalus singaporensis]|uniref:Purine hydroxylase delta subunit apoprotein n=1 Tax=Desulforhopalus singaporensis TaxID=91360 RepID=A0A1H0SK76_9BACT|nr:(2Fe-2S)-binding protein [Desulforhopalus singaporensis]SDP42144.1 purine hydroxylase delta subunit apoprotein [Desulforhopalus singaporensis]